ncbi:hypothetical protein KAR91_61040 [Candidatus Pacearchaeota archaeon]|nr:hypothetical protein [Candidatus Pacearchaeota archaeon]
MAISDQEADAEMVRLKLLGKRVCLCCGKEYRLTKDSDPLFCDECTLEITFK